MTAISIVGYMHRLKQAGFTDQQSEVQASQLEQVVTEIKSELATKRDLEELRLATKKDIELVIAELKYQTLKFVVWTGIGVIAAIGSMLAKGFHWF